MGLVRWILGAIAPLALLLVSANGPSVRAEDEASALSEFAKQMADQRTALLEIRRGIHRHPEVSGDEKRTTRVVAEYLASVGFDVRTGLGGHGVVAVLEGAGSGPVIAFRADMDAVRSAADDPMEFRSEVAGVNHICGHDIHTAVFLALLDEPLVEKQ